MGEVDLREAADEALVAFVLAGDAAASRELFGRYEAELRRRARGRLRGVLKRKVSESDVAQETYAAASQGLEGFVDRGPGSYRAWLLQILDHKISDQERRWLGTGKRDARREVSPPPSGSPEAEQAASRLPSPSEEANRAETKARMLEGIALLDPEDARLVRSVHEDDLTFEEIARRTGRTADAVRKHYGRAIQRLARTMKKTGLV